MKKQDLIKVGIAVACLVIAGVVIIFQFTGGDGGNSASANETIGDTDTTVGEAERMSEEELRALAEEEGALYGGGGNQKPTPRRR